MAGEEGFGARLSLAMKLLNLSNGALASEAKADKSLVSRWARGLATPRGPYRAVLTEIVRARVPSFNQVSWELPLDEFARLLGAPEPIGPAPIVPAGAVSPPASESKGDATTAVSLPAPKARWRRSGIAALLVLAVLLLASAILWRRAARPAADTAAMAAAAPPSVAVLPFDNLSGDPAKAYFSDGVAEELLDELANVPGLRVASRTDSFALKGKGLDTAAIAARLHVSTVLEGSVREDGKRVRITAQLVNAANGFPIWSQSFDRDLTDVLRLQDEIGRAITGALSQRLLAGAGRPTPPQIDPEVYREYLQAVGAFYSSSLPDHQRSVALLKDVTARAPTFADGFGQLGMSLTALSDMDRDLVFGPLADQAFSRALQLDPNNRRAIGGYPLLLFKEWRWREAADASFRAGRHGDDAGRRALALMYFELDLPERTAAVERRLVASRPTDYWQYGYLSEALYRTGHYAEANEVARKGELLQGGEWALADQCAPLAMLGDIAAARAVERRLTSSPQAEVTAAHASCMEAIAVQTHDLKALRALAETFANHFPHTSEIGAKEIGDFYQQAGDLDQAMTWFDRSFARREPTLFAQTGNRDDQQTPEGRRLADDPRWQALFQRPASMAWRQVRAAVAAMPVPPE